MEFSLSESPSGLVHVVKVFPHRTITRCGRTTDEGWTRIRDLDPRLGGRTLSSIRRMVEQTIELPVCERCFPF